MTVFTYIVVSFLSAFFGAFVGCALELQYSVKEECEKQLKEKK